MRPFFLLVIGLIFLFGSPTNVRAREDQRMDAGWHFKLEDVLGAENSGFDDSGWQTVSLPHNWGWEDAQLGKNYYRRPGWYRRELAVGVQPGKRYFLRFEAASLAADVYLNGKYLG